MEQKQFVERYLPFALTSEKKTGISAIAILAQAAIESGWGEVAPGNMFFGVKDHDGINGNEQLLKTTEYNRRADLKFPVIISVKPINQNGVKMFRYVVKDYFRKYATPEESFTDHGNFFLVNPRYKDALLVRSDPYKFTSEIAKAGYATDPKYAKKLERVINDIKKWV